ncbi:NAD-dependent epimerase/dehydratase family protein [Pseudomonas sp. C 49-2]|uniref:GDP-mannose 4,6-dehydratase n=1 Tax=Pseudomonas canadensis TaxID=915099 RepID=A0ABZ1A1Y1_9PSED|nr:MULTISPECIES: GDP-mannose 4,6-dehydratase [Pseudomonas]MEB2646813.1 GDP-mannose 4,6-dehydratase [Pseudomonas canadensis]RTX99453.1 NAD-dependent epimerase/dehydratase family protein [Pseudomonas sp. C 49-2]WRI23398.1 GDP-mannose 4,6-dehydratase [Pseudomonas canadensis]
MKHVLLTGANGFVGKVLLEQLLAAGYRVSCACTSPGASLRADVEHVLLDIRDAQACAATLERIKPTHVLHLAAVSHVPTSFRDPLLTWNTNVLGTMNLLEAIKQKAPDAFVVLVSSSEVYGEAFKAGVALDESSPCLPMNPYAASKLAAELAGEQYFRQGVRGVIARPFNHIGAGQSPDFVTASFARQIALIESGKQAPVIQVGNLDAYRDFLDVRDVCSAYLQLLTLSEQSGYPRLFNISSANACQIRSVLNELVGQSRQSIAVELDPQRLRPSDIPFAVGNSDRMRDVLNWQPTISLKDTLASLLVDWRSRVETEQ